MPDTTAPKVDWDQPLTVTARRGDIAAAAQALGHANNPSAKAMAFCDSLNSVLASPGQDGINGKESPTMLRHERNFWAWKHRRREAEIQQLREELPPESPNYLAPSDSQGDQERCKRCGDRKTIWEQTPEGPNEGEWIDCPDCNPAPTQVEGDEKLSPDLEALAAAAAEVEALEDARLSDLACLLLNLWGDGWKVVRAESEQPEGGDEEDWPEKLAADFEQRADEQEQHASEWVEAKMATLAYRCAAKRLREVSGHYKSFEVRCKEAEDRASKAEAKADEYREGWLLRGRQINEEGAVLRGRAERYENALEELAAEFQAGGVAERDSDEPGVPSSAYYDCAAKVREKAAKLKEGR